MGKHIFFRDKKIHYSVQGSGKQIVLLHGFMESMSIWKYFARKLSNEFQVILVDLPGHGRSETIAPVHTMEIMASAVHVVLKELNVSTCMMAGHSMGGYVCLAFAEKYPRKIKGLSLFHSHAAADSTEAQHNRDRAINLVRKDRKGYIRNLIPDLFDPGNIERFNSDIVQLKALASSIKNEAIIAALEGMKIRPDRTHMLTGSRVPVQFIIGKNDTRLPMQLLIPQTVLPPRSEVILLDHVGHMGFIESREDTYQALYHFCLKVLG